MKNFGFSDPVFGNGLYRAFALDGMQSEMFPDSLGLIVMAPPRDVVDTMPEPYTWTQEA